MRVLIYSIFTVFLFPSCDHDSKLNEVKPVQSKTLEQNKVFLDSNSKNKIIQEVLKGQKVCGTAYNCFKPVNFPDSKVKVLEIDIHSKTQVSIATYDKNGEPVDLEDDFVIQFRATKVPATLNADVVRK